jgi:hypothetical protein
MRVQRKVAHTAGTRRRRAGDRRPLRRHGRWHRDASLYGFFTGFKDPLSGCEVRPTARSDGDKVVNDYEEVVDGTKLSFLDTFQDITANSHTLVFAWIKDRGSIRTRDYRQGRAAFKILGTLLSRAAKSGLGLLATLAMLFAPADAGMWERRDHRPALRARHRERSVGLDGQRFAVR